MARMKKAARRAALAAAMAAALVSADLGLNNTYDLEIVKIVDSDTYRAVASVWPGPAQKIDVRVDGIDTPEKFRPSPECRDHERALANRASQFVRTAIDRATRVYVTGVGLGKYAGRVVGRVMLVDAKGDAIAISDLLMSAGYAVEYHGGTKVTNWCKVSM